jgi:hypothetical protein
MLVRRCRCAWLVRALALGLPVVGHLLSGPHAFAQSIVPTTAPAVNTAAIRDGELVAAIKRAAGGARRRLAQVACAAVLDEFADQTGRSLSDVAAALALGADESLARVIFRDGRESASCRQARPAAFAGVGSRVVFVCPATFAALDSESAELVIIHELLHTLGLGERPPSSSHINRVVARRCS